MTPKVLIVIDTRIIGGPGRGLFHFLDSADHSTFEYTLCAFKYKTPGSQEFLEEVLKRGYRVEVIEQRGAHDLLPVKHLAKMISRDKYNIIQSHGYKSHLFAALIKARHKIKWIAFSHGWTAENLKVKSYNALDRCTLRFADVNIGVSNKIRDKLIKIAGRKRRVLTIENAINIGAFAFESGSNFDSTELRKSLGIPPTAQILGCFGRLSPEKGQSLLLQAVKSLARDDLYIVFLGDGVSRDVLQTQANSLELTKFIRFVGYQSNTLPYFKMIDCLVIPSLSEGLPNVLLEAMACRKPVVSTPVGAVPQIIKDGQTGFLAHSIDANALSQALVRFLENKPNILMITEQAFQLIENEFGAEVRAKKIVNVYRSLI